MSDELEYGDELNLDLGAGMVEAVEESYKPPLAEGFYLAVVTKGEAKKGKEAKKLPSGKTGVSMGLNHHIGVNKKTWAASKNELLLEWVSDEKAGTYPLRDYAWLGDWIEGEGLVYRPTKDNPNGAPGFAVVNWVKALGLTVVDGRIPWSPSKVTGKVVIVKIAHEASRDDEDMVFPVVKSVYPVKIEDEDGNIIIAPDVKEMPVFVADEDDE